MNKLINFLFPSIERTREYDEITALSHKATLLSFRGRRAHLQFQAARIEGANVAELERLNIKHAELTKEHEEICNEHERRSDAWFKKYNPRPSETHQ